MKFNQPAGEEDGRIVQKMNRTLLHRGPDAQETLLTGPLAMGFCRLSIIGLNNGSQPIFSEDEQIVIICNGEIFNYMELRMELKDKGHRFRTDSDVEVIVHLYEECGTRLLDRLNGQFAFALYDRGERRLFCARDHLGIIPFYYTMAGNSFIFGSEIKAILGHPAVSREVDRVGLDQVLTFAGLISPRTMFKNIHSLENGHFLLVDEDGTMVNHEYWDLVYPEGEVRLNGKPESAYIDELEGLFESSIRLRLRSDVPTGLYLSGGLDSSMIAMKIEQIQPGECKESFCIDFLESQYSESKYQKLVAKQSNSALNQMTFFYSDICQRLAQAIYHCECPIKETYNTASLMLSQAVRSKGIKVIQSGEGADEFFAGYVGYRFDRMRKLNPVPNGSPEPEQALRNSIWGDPDFFYEKNYLEFDKVKQALYSAEMNSHYEDINCLNHSLINKDRVRNRDVVNQRAYIDYKIRLVDHLVSDHGDRMALANSVEVRYPFLDKELVEFSTRIPTSLKLNDFTEKYILRKMADRFVPRTVIEREKFHFIAPGSAYLLQRNIEYIGDILSYERIKKQGFFNPDQVERLRKQYAQPGFSINAPYEDDLLIIVITFGILLDTFFN